ncbi:MAG: PEBP family protein [Gammaproteobacteria bacterium]|nr:PEBP family protein [Gammaproteobacteria bacterium]
MAVRYDPSIHWTEGHRMALRHRFALLGVVALGGCGDAPIEPTAIDSPGGVSIHGEIWADNWFALYLGERLIVEDSTPITTERSFNAESFVFNGDYPLQVNLVAKDFKENDTGLEYIGASNQQMGDGGFIAQFTDPASGQLIAASDTSWRCLTVHEAPLDRTCEEESEPRPGVAPCEFRASSGPEGWMSPDVDDSAWPHAREFSPATVRPKGGYDRIQWRQEARLIWTADLETHNTLLCRLTIPAP